MKPAGRGLQGTALSVTAVAIMVLGATLTIVPLSNAASSGCWGECRSSSSSTSSASTCRDSCLSCWWKCTTTTSTTKTATTASTTTTTSSTTVIVTSRPPPEDPCEYGGRCFTSFVGFNVTVGGQVVDANVTLVRTHGPTQVGTTEVGTPLQMVWYDVSTLDTVSYTVALPNGSTVTGSVSNPNPGTGIVVNVIT